MKQSQSKLQIAFLTLLLLIGLTACSSSSSPTSAANLDDQQVKNIVQNMLIGYNHADYAVFSRDLSPAVKLVATKEAFQLFCQDSVPSLGKYKSITGLQQLESSSTSTIWQVTAEFDHSTQLFNVTVDNKSGQIEGMDFGPNG